MSLGLRSYRLVTGALEPFAGLALRQRVRKGKENAARLPERLGRATQARPPGRLVWLHGASVGETALMINLYERLRERLPDIVGLFTSQTLTSAAMFTRRAPAGAVHQMAPVDGPAAVRRFLAHWRPDAFILAEGEIWPNLIHQVGVSGAPAALVNARMTQKSLDSWYTRPAAAREIFNSFSFIGAADARTARGLRRAAGRQIVTIGNLKQATDAPAVDDAELAAWTEALGGRPVLLAASTHAGEEALAAQAFLPLSKRDDHPLFILAPRHPERAKEAVQVLKAQGLDFKQRSKDASNGCDAPVLLADTMGEMGLWMRLARAVYLGGGHAEGVGGHNPIEPLKLNKPVFSGPNVFNFADLMDRLKPFSGIVMGAEVKDLKGFFEDWLDETARAPDWAAIENVFADVERPLEQTIEAIVDMIKSGQDA